MASEAEETGGAAAAVPVGPEVARLELVVREVDGPGGPRRARPRGDPPDHLGDGGGSGGRRRGAAGSGRRPVRSGRRDRRRSGDARPTAAVERAAPRLGADRSGARPWSGAWAVSGWVRPLVRPGQTAAHAGPTRVVVRTVAGPDAGREIELAAGTSVVGRSRAVDVVLDDPAVASRQAVLSVDPDGAVTVTDLCSPRPTRAGGQVVDGADLAAAGPAADDGQLDAGGRGGGRRGSPSRPRAGDRPPDPRSGRPRVGRLDRRPPPAAARTRPRGPSPRCGCPPPHRRRRRRRHRPARRSS